MSKAQLLFLKDVFIFTLTAFGGAQAHIAMMLKEFVEKKKYLTEEELIAYNALGQMLPGPSSTQTLIAIAYKFGGIYIALFALLIWIAPAGLMMFLFAVSFSYFDLSGHADEILLFVKPMAIGFVAYSAYILTTRVLSSRFSYILASFAVLITILFQNAYVFPIVLAVGVLFAALFIPPNEIPKERVRFNPKKLIPFLAILFVFALMGAIINRTSLFSLPVRMFENFYRNGIMIFGGGQVLIPLLYTEFVEMKAYLTAQEFFSGFALQQAIPGPVFSFTSFVGGIAMRGEGLFGQLLGSTAALIGINLPGVLFIFTIFPIWESLKKGRFIQRALIGINSVSVGFVIAACYIMIKPIGYDWMALTTIAITFLLLKFTKIPAPVLILLALVLGFWVG